MTWEHDYLDIVNRVVCDGEQRCGRNGAVQTLFGERIVLDLKAGFPLVTTKRVFWRGVVEELLWFLRGSTNARELQEKNVHIWDKNSSREYLDKAGLHHLPEGEIGDGYGKQWRNYGGQKDQLKYIVNELQTCPHGRRCILTAWNPLELTSVALPPCHIMYQFYIGRGGLSCQMIQRSQDLMSGAPFNYASTALLTHIIAHTLHIDVDKVIVVTGDTHVYSEHIDNAKVQVKREPFTHPRLTILKESPEIGACTDTIVAWMESLTFEDFRMDKYEHWPSLKFDMVA